MKKEPTPKLTPTGRIKKNRANPNNRDIELCSRLIELNPNDHAAYFARAQAKKNQCDWKGAIEDYKSGLALKPDEHHELYQLGTILSNLGDYRGAIVDYNTAIESNPPHAGSYYLRGLEKIKIKDFQGAPDNFNKLIEIDPDYKNAYLNRAYIKLITDDYQGAIADFKKVGITTPLSFFEERNMQMVNNQQEITTVKVATLYCDNISSLEALAKQVRKMKIYDIYDY